MRISPSRSVSLRRTDLDSVDIGSRPHIGCPAFVYSCDGGHAGLVDLPAAGLALSSSQLAARAAAARGVGTPSLAAAAWRCLAPSAAPPPAPPPLNRALRQAALSPLHLAALFVRRCRQAAQRRCSVLGRGGFLSPRPYSTLSALRASGTNLALLPRRPPSRPRCARTHPLSKQPRQLRLRPQHRLHALLQRLHQG